MFWCSGNVTTDSLVLRSQTFAVVSSRQHALITFEEGKLAIEESLSMPEQRVQPSQYRAFAAFARAVDEAQSGELQVE